MSSKKKSTATEASPNRGSVSYLWICDKCRCKNSNYAEKCSSCRAPKPGSSAAATSSAATASRSFKTVTQVISPPKQSGVTSRTAAKPPAAQSSMTKSPFRQSSTSTAMKSTTTSRNVAKQQTKTPKTRIIPITVTSPSVTKTVSPGRSSLKGMANNLVIIRKNPMPLDRNKPRSLSVSTDEFQEFVINKQLSPERRAISTYNAFASTSLKEEVVEALRMLIKDSTPLPTSLSKTATLLPLLRQTTKEHSSRFKQKLKALKSTHFTDDGFRANRSSLYLSTEESVQLYDKLISKWLRIGEIKLDSPEKNNPGKQQQLVVHGAGVSVSDFRQGTIGDCWFICALASLVWHHAGHLGVIIPDSTYHPEGLYQIFFCLDGQWAPIEIDDYFPCDGAGRLVFSQTSGNSIFAPLIEKALAKHHTCYKALSAGTVLEGFSNITGMPCKRRDISARTKVEQSAFWRKLHINLKTFKYLVSAGCTRAANGLHSGHAYSILDILNIATPEQKALLLWNPWGRQELTGSFGSFNTLISKKYSAIRLQPGMFWLRFADFLNCFEQIDICKINPKWNCHRFEFSLPFDLTDKERNFTIFNLEVPSKVTHFEFTIYQTVHRDIQFKWRLDLSLVIFRQLSDGSLAFTGTSRVCDNKVSSFGKRLPPGRYVVAVIGFNHWGQTSRLKSAPRLVLAFHGSKPFNVEALTSEMSLLGDMLIELALAIGERSNSQRSEVLNYRQYVVMKNCSFISVIENGNTEEHIITECDTSTSQNAFSIRSAKVTCDIVPPKSRQVIVILSRECDKDRCSYSARYSVFRGGASSPVNLSKHNVPSDVKSMGALFAPRRIKEEAEVEKHRAKRTTNAPVEVHSDEEDEDTWKPPTGRGCCVH